MRTLLCILLTACSNCLAHNNLFFPGDAFFSSSIAESIDLQKEDSLSAEFHYERLSSSYMLCGYLGYSTLRISDVPAPVRKNLGVVREKMFSDYEKYLLSQEEEDEETGKKEVIRSFPILIYNRGFDFLKHPIGLRLNEDWVTIQVNEAKREHAIYDGPENSRLILADWRFSSEVPGLTCKLDRKGLKEFMGSKEPITCDGKDIVFVVPIGSSVWEIAKMEKGSRFFVVSETVREFVVTNKGLKEQSEQGGADQPATAPESKSEGKEKPKPESEGRSQ